MATKNKKRVPHWAPPLPPGWTSKITGPEYEDGESVESANAKWNGYLRLVQRLKPMPRRTWSNVKGISRNNSNNQ